MHMNTKSHTLMRTLHVPTHVLGYAHMLTHTQESEHRFAHFNTHVTHTRTILVFSLTHTHSDADVGGNNCHFAGRISALSA